MSLRRSLAGAVAALLLTAGLIVSFVGTDSQGSIRPETPLRASDYPVPESAVFVSTRGSDAAAGTRSAPLRTLAAGVRKAKDGQTVVLRAGTYRESIGLVRKRLTIQPYAGEQVWFKGSVVVDDWEAADGAWEHAGWDPDLCEDCYLPGIVDPAYPMAGNPHMAFVDGRPLHQVGSRDEVQPGTFYVGEQTVVIGDDPDGRRVELTAYDHLLQFDGAAAAGSRLRGVGVAQYGSNQRYGARGAMVVVNARDVVVERTTFAQSASTGLAVFQSGGQVRDSDFTGNGLLGLHANLAHNLRVTDSRLTGNNAERFALSGEYVGAAGAKVTHTKRPYFARNTFTANHATGWWCDLGCTDAVVVDNTASGNRGHGMHYEVSARARIASNVLERNRSHGLKVSSSDHVRIEQNRFTDNRGGSVGLYNDPRQPSFDPYSEALGLTWLTEGLVLLDNVYRQRADRPVVQSADHRPDPSGNPAFVADANRNSYRRVAGHAPLVVLVHGDGAARGYPNLARLRAATGFEQDGSEGPR